jgi:CheY-like chemotaxis protein
MSGILTQRRLSVLLVDDCAEQRDLYEFVLAPDFDIRTASRGAEAIALAQAQPPDVIVLDISMPEMSGLETCRRLKANRATATIPVIMLTGLDHALNQGLLAGAFTVLEKPCPDRKLIEAIATAVGCATD